MSVALKNGFLPIIDKINRIDQKHEHKINQYLPAGYLQVT